MRDTEEQLTQEQYTEERNFEKGHLSLDKLSNGHLSKEPSSKDYPSELYPLERHTEGRLTEVEQSRVIEMAWEDRTPFEAIEDLYGLPEKEVIKIMRSNLKNSSFKRWRKRVNSGVSQKHLHKRNSDITRFKCSRQRAITGNKIRKR